MRHRFDVTPVSGLLLLTTLLVSPPEDTEASSGPGDVRSEPVPVARVDLARYVGTWYELAKIPNRFQKNCADGTTATYAIREDGRLDVINRCRKVNGKLDEAMGIARVVNPATNSRLEVSFFSILGIRPFWGDYWIIGLGDDYQFAVVGTPDRKYGWVLSRTPRPDPDIMKRAVEILVRQGYDPGVFEPTSHYLTRPPDSSS